MEGVNLFYKTNEEKRKWVTTIHIPIDDYILRKIIHKVNSINYTLGKCDFTAKIFKMPIKLKEDEYFVLFCFDIDGVNIRGNIMEKKYLDDFFPEIFVIENRKNIIDDILSSE